MMSVKSVIKKRARAFYYFFNHDKVVSMRGYTHLSDTKWILHSKFGMAYYKGYYEKEISCFLEKNLKPDSVFVDVGAHAGYFSLFAAKLAVKGHVYSFEPDADNFAFQKRIQTLNEVDNWTAYPYAAGDQKQTLKYSKGQSSTTGTVGSDGEIEVLSVTLDETLSKAEKISIIKIDVEGFGGRVLEGGMKVIHEHRPVILFETHKGSDEVAVLKKLLGSSYDFLHLKTEQILPLDQDPHFVYARPKQ